MSDQKEKVKTKKEESVIISFVFDNSIDFKFAKIITEQQEDKWMTGFVLCDRNRIYRYESALLKTHKKMETAKSYHLKIIKNDISWFTKKVNKK